MVSFLLGVFVGGTVVLIENVIMNKYMQECINMSIKINDNRKPNFVLREGIYR